ncbi:hypothetical protein BKA70DRAFT_1445291 [Coprinopsis sp. MPI-PUGE-AT-0042]|nr:hypothetical protein BKA70DRAFT_1445291 [Coprinopsis sp. MPI-PUGE-AT-0042]
MGMTKALEEAGITEADLQLRLLHLIGVWLQGFLYGVYLCLFIAASPMLVQRNTLKNFSAAVFVMGNIFMFVLISIHSATSICLPIFAFAYQTDSQGISRMLHDQRHWAKFISIILGVVIFLTADILVIYRCFIIWQRRYLVILVPCLLVALAVCIAVATIVFVYSVPPLFVLARHWPIISLPFISRDVGLVSVHTPKLLPIVKIFVESAVVYTAGVLVIAVLVVLDHPAWCATQSCMMPTIGAWVSLAARLGRIRAIICQPDVGTLVGIVFVLMALRIHAVGEESKEMLASPSLLPSWLVDDKSDSMDSSDPKPVEKEEHRSPTRLQTRPLRHPGDSLQTPSQV